MKLSKAKEDPDPKKQLPVNRNKKKPTYFLVTFFFFFNLIGKWPDVKQ